MLDLIDRWEAMRIVSAKKDKREIRNALAELTNPDIREHGFWFLITEILGDFQEDKKMCSLCHARFPVMEMDYCPHCGAQMDLGKTEEEQ